MKRVVIMSQKDYDLIVDSIRNAMDYLYLPEECHFRNEILDELKAAEEALITPDN